MNPTCPSTSRISATGPANSTKTSRHAWTVMKRTPCQSVYAALTERRVSTSPGTTASCSSPVVSAPRRSPPSASICTICRHSTQSLPPPPSRKHTAALSTASIRPSPVCTTSTWLPVMTPPWRHLRNSVGNRAGFMYRTCSGLPASDVPLPRGMTTRWMISTLTLFPSRMKRLPLALRRIPRSICRI